MNARGRLTDSYRTAVGALLAVGLSTGCGGSKTAQHTTSTVATERPSVAACGPQARAAVARVLAVAPGSVVIAPSTGNNGMPQCTFAARAGCDGQLSVTANLYDGPQPYLILERTTVETAQLFTPKRMVPAPQAITGLGLEADWFPAHNQLMTTDGIRLVTVSVD